MGSSVPALAEETVTFAVDSADGGIQQSTTDVIAPAATQQAATPSEALTQALQPMPQQPTSTPNVSKTTSSKNKTKTQKFTEIHIIRKPTALKGLRNTSQSRHNMLLEWKSSKRAAVYQVYRKSKGHDYQLLGTTKKVNFTDKKLHWGISYYYKVVPVNRQKKKGTAGVIHCQTGTFVKPGNAKYTYVQMIKDMRKMAALYRDYCSLSSIGKSVEGRQLYDFAIGNPKAKKSILVVCTLHAREYICSAVIMQQAEYYLQHYNGTVSGVTPAKVLSNVQIHYLMMSNPDGVTISQTEKSQWKANGRGVDLNRNFPASVFKVGGKKGAEGYSGPYALSEPESRAIAAFTKKLIQSQKLLGNINYHAMGQIIFGDCSEKSLATDTELMYNIAKRLTGYRSSTGYQASTPASGGQYREYVMYQLGVPSITIEMGRSTAPCPFWEYSSAYRQNRDVVFSIANALKDK
jgi:hypothetical protein